MNIKIALSAAALALGSLLFGCGPQTYVIQQYDGPVRDSETIAILRINADDTARVVSLDGEYADPRVEEGTRLHIELLPGPHTLRVANAADPETGSRVVRFEAHAGRVYRVVLEATQSVSPPLSPAEGWGHLPSRQHEATPAHVFEVDRGSDRLLRRVTAPARAPLGPAPLPQPAPTVVAPAAPGPSAPLPAPDASTTPAPGASATPALGASATPPSASPIPAPSTSVTSAPSAPPPPVVPAPPRP